MARSLEFEEERSIESTTVDWDQKGCAAGNTTDTLTGSRRR